MIFNNATHIRVYIFSLFALLAVSATIYAITSRDGPNATPGYQDVQGQGKIQEVPPRTEGWQVYQNAELGFTIRYPQGYKAQPQPEAINFELEHLPRPTPIYYAHFNPNPPDPDRGNISMEVWTNPSNLLAGQWLERTFPAIKDYSTVNNISFAEADGLQWIVDESPLFINTLLPKGNKIFWIRLRLPDEQRNKEFENIYNAMIESFVRNK